MGWLFIIILLILCIVVIYNSGKEKQERNERIPVTSLKRDNIIREKVNFDRTFIIAGTGHRGSDVKESIAAMASVPSRNLSRCTVKLKPEPSNQYDEFAVQIYIEGIFFGYVPAFMSEEVAENIANGHRHTCQVIEITDLGGVVMGIK